MIDSQSVGSGVSSRFGDVPTLWLKGRAERERASPSPARGRSRERRDVCAELTWSTLSPLRQHLDDDYLSLFRLLIILFDDVTNVTSEETRRRIC